MITFKELEQKILKEKESVKQITLLFDRVGETQDKEEKRKVMTETETLGRSIKEQSQDIINSLKEINLARPLKKKHVKIPLGTGELEKESILAGKSFITELEERTLKRLQKEEEKKIRKKLRKPGKYVQASSKIFSDISKKLLKSKSFQVLETDLIKGNLSFVPSGYVSIVLSTTCLVFIISFLLFLFLLFFSLSPLPPFVSYAGQDLGMRFARYIWIVLIAPVATYVFMYSYPFLEKKSAEVKINQELPFATINMAAISGSMIDPTKIFSIIISTGEYPNLEKEFTQLMNEINIYGYDLITALKNIAKNSPSKKLAELLNGLSTTISSGGDLPEFFKKRAETLLFEHKIQKEKDTKSAETFMNVYISIVIAAPMILMLLLMMIKIGGIGISLSTTAITMIVVTAVSLINIVFLTFLHIKQSSSGA